MSGKQIQPFDRDLRDRLAANLAGHELRTHSLDGRRHAAVSVIVIDSDPDAHGDDPGNVDRQLDLQVPGRPVGFTGRVDGTAGGAAVLLTRRAGHLPTNPRQWAFPGGRLDGDETALEAAIREANEEVGLTLNAADLLGRLDDYPTRTGYVISPFVFWVADQDPVPDPAEVASVHRIGFHELQRPDSPRFVEIAESDRPVVQVPIGGDLVHAPTGAILYQFRSVAIDGEPIRVDHLEQPVFAWK